MGEFYFLSGLWCVIVLQFRSFWQGNKAYSLSVQTDEEHIVSSYAKLESDDIDAESEEFDFWAKMSKYLFFQFCLKTIEILFAAYLIVIKSYFILGSFLLYKNLIMFGLGRHWKSKAENYAIALRKLPLWALRLEKVSQIISVAILLWVLGTEMSLFESW